MKRRGGPNRNSTIWVCLTSLSRRATNFGTHMQVPHANTLAKFQCHAPNKIPFTLDSKHHSVMCLHSQYL